MLSPLLFSMFMHDCIAIQSSISIMKFADTTTLTRSPVMDETAYRVAVRALTS
jgi:hypothetical protein